MRESGIADDGYGRPESAVCGTLCHGDGCTHFDAGLDCLERGQPAEGVAADVAEGAALRVVFLHYGVECREEVPVAAALAECRGPGGDDGGCGELAVRRKAEGLPDAVGREFAGAGQGAVQTAGDLDAGGEDAVHAFFQKGLAFLQDEDAVAHSGELDYKILGERILGNLEDGVRAAVGIILHKVVVGDAAGDDAEGAVGAVLQTVVRGLCGILLEAGVILDELPVTDAGVGGEGAPLAFVLGEFQCVLRMGVGVVGTLYGGAGMGQAGGEAHQHRDAAGLGVFECAAHHLIGLLLAGGFEDGNQGEGTPEAGVLLVLRAVHGRVVAGGDDEAAVRSGGGGAHERVGADVHADVLHADERAFAGEGHAKGFLHCRFFVGRPGAVNLAVPGERMRLDEFGDFG